MDETQRFIKLKETIGNLSNTKIRLEERFKSEKERLEKLLAEITAKGYDPKKLGDIKKEKEAQLQKMLEELETKTKEVNEKLSLIEA